MAQGALTEGSIQKNLTKLAMPIMLSGFLSSAYNITDMFWVGKLGVDVVAGVGIGGMYIWLSNGLAALARMGGQVCAGWELGRGNHEKANRYAHASIVLALLFAVLFGTACLVFTDTLVAFFGLENATAIHTAKNYIRIACGLVLFQYLNLVLTGLYTIQGDSKTPLKANFFGLAWNMILDPILIFGLGPAPRLNGSGAAVATVLAQVIVFGILIFSIVRDKNEQNILKRISIRELPDGICVRQILKTGAPTALQSTVYCAISMCLSKMISSFGDAAVAVHRVGNQVENICWNMADGFGVAVNAFTAQNYGAGNMERIRKGYNISALIVFVWGGVIGLLFMLFPETISSWFFYETEVIALSADYFRILGIGEALMCVELMAQGAIAGLGKTNVCSAISISLTAVRIPLAWLLSCTNLGLNGIWWAYSISSVSKGIVMHIAFRKQCITR